VRHPLQPFDPRNFRAGELGRAGPLSFDASALGGARAMAAPRLPPAPFLPAPLTELSAAEPVELARLVSFVEHPVKAFLRQRLGVVLPGSGDELSDVLPVELDALTSWQVGDRMLRARLAGADSRTCREAEWRRGALPPGPLGCRVLDDICTDVERLVEAVDGLWSTEPDTVDVLVTSPGSGSPLVGGSVAGVHGDALLTVTYSKLSAKHRLGAWVRLLVLCAAKRGSGLRAVTVGRAGGGAKRSVIEGLGADDARRHLTVLVDLYLRGMREPLPFARRASAVYADARRRGCSPEAALTRAGAEWSQSAREAAEAEHELVWGPGTVLAALATAPPAADEKGAGWPAEPSRFGVLALRLWEPLLAAERIENA
jgi:exodeoxyribonuclease V gamma subunit